MRLRAGLDAVEKRQALAPAGNRTPIPWTSSQSSSRSNSSGFIGASTAEPIPAYMYTRAPLKIPTKSHIMYI
jgi:hypothetical protein